MHCFSCDQSTAWLNLLILFVYWLWSVFTLFLSCFSSKVELLRTWVPTHFPGKIVYISHFCHWLIMQNYFNSQLFLPRLCLEELAFLSSQKMNCNSLHISSNSCVDSEASVTARKGILVLEAGRGISTFLLCRFFSVIIFFSWAGIS